MDINQLQKALAIMNKHSAGGDVIALEDRLYLLPMADSFTASEVNQLEELGFTMNEEGGFECST